MKIHLVRSEELDTGLFTRVYSLLNAVPGPVTFTCDPEALINFEEDELLVHRIPDEEKFNRIEERSMFSLKDGMPAFPLERKTASWKTLFAKAGSYRKKHRIPDTEFVLLLTDIPNLQNWFALLDEQMPFNGFIHTGDWEAFMACPPEFPIAYEVVALALQKHLFREMDDMDRIAHKTPIGCVSDLCMEKKDITLKLRTADICSSCAAILREQLAPPVIHHSLQLMESLRVKMLFAQNSRVDSPPSRLQINKRFEFSLPDYGDIQLPLRPLEKALYLLFLRHPEGIYLSSLSEHREELYEIYTSLSSRGMAEEMQARIDDLTNALSNSASEKISRIRRVFTEAIGYELAKMYIISGQSGELRKIGLDREMVNMQMV